MTYIVTNLNTGGTYKCKAGSVKGAIMKALTSNFNTNGTLRAVNVADLQS